MWQTYTPDNELLVLRRTDSGWLATCLSARAESASAEAAIREAIGVGKPSGDEELEAWIAEHVSALESENG
jgi:pyruvoyl-dependent arginine decarboxylase (PvlArgDC)